MMPAQSPIEEDNELLKGEASEQTKYSWLHLAMALFRVTTSTSGTPAKDVPTKTLCVSIGKNRFAILSPLSLNGLNVRLLNVSKRHPESPRIIGSSVWRMNQFNRLYSFALFPGDGSFTRALM